MPGPGWNYPAPIFVDYDVFSADCPAWFCAVHYGETGDPIYLQLLRYYHPGELIDIMEYEIDEVAGRSVVVVQTLGQFLAILDAYDFHALCFYS